MQSWGINLSVLLKNTTRVQNPAHIPLGQWVSGTQFNWQSSTLHSLYSKRSRMKSFYVILAARKLDRAGLGGGGAPWLAPEPIASSLFCSRSSLRAMPKRLFLWKHLLLRLDNTFYLHFQIHHVAVLSCRIWRCWFVCLAKLVLWAQWRLSPTKKIVKTLESPFPANSPCTFKF